MPGTVVGTEANKMNKTEESFPGKLSLDLDVLLSYVKEPIATVEYKECYYSTPRTSLDPIVISL